MPFVFPIAFMGGTEQFASVVELDPVEGSGTAPISNRNSDIFLPINNDVFGRIVNELNFDIAEWEDAGTYELTFLENTLNDLNGNVTSAVLVEIRHNNTGTIQSVTDITTFSFNGTGTLPSQLNYTTLGGFRGLGIEINYAPGSRSVSGSVKFGVKPVV